nr:LOW QUALITY PROTEIN: golgin subfamily A member 6-like protein 6 [Chlorocebus sabaeus]
MWPQPHRPTHPMMSEETRAIKLAKAKEKLRDYHPQANPGVGTGAGPEGINNGANPGTSTSGGCHSYEDEKKASHQHQEALRRELEAQVHTIRILTCEKTRLRRHSSYSQCAVQQLEGESRHLVSRLHDSWNFARDLERDLSAVATQKKKADRVSPTTCRPLNPASQMEDTSRELTKERDALSLEAVRGSITDDELKEKNAELQEKLRLVESEKSEIQLNVKELERKLEKAKLLLPQQQLGRADHWVRSFQSVSAAPGQVEENKLWNRLYQQQEEKMWRQQEKIHEQEEKIREQAEKMHNQEEKIREQEEKIMHNQEEKMQEQEEKMHNQEGEYGSRRRKMHNQEEKIREQVENMHEQKEKIREQEEKMHEQKEKIREQEEKMQEQEEKMWRQEEKIFGEQKECLMKQEKKMCEQEEKLWEKEKRLWQLEEKMQKQEEHLEAAIYGT